MKLCDLRIYESTKIKPLDTDFKNTLVESQAYLSGVGIVKVTDVKEAADANDAGSARPSGAGL